jgi:hypothetical protein
VTCWGPKPGLDARWGYGNGSGKDVCLLCCSLEMEVRRAGPVGVGDVNGASMAGLIKLLEWQMSLLK